MQDFQTNAKKELELVVRRLGDDVALLHSSRATPALVEHILVQSYGQKMPLNQLASLSAPDARTIIIQPWDASVLPEIRKTIETSGLGMGISAEEKFIRLTMPQLSDERRKELVKVLGKKVEESRMMIRRIRDHVMKSVEEAFRKKEISEDDKFRSRENLQKIIDEYVNKADEIESRKVKEIESV